MYIYIYIYIYYININSNPSITLEYDMYYSIYSHNRYYTTEGNTVKIVYSMFIVSLYHDNQSHK